LTNVKYGVASTDLHNSVSGRQGRVQGFMRLCGPDLRSPCAKLNLPGQPERLSKLRLPYPGPRRMDHDRFARCSHASGNRAPLSAPMMTRARTICLSIDDGRIPVRWHCT
jgi:hypothetical protein